MLEGKVALITGAAKGIGRAIALAMAVEKATVVINYNGSKERAEQVLEEVKALGADGCVYQCNVADTADTDAMIKEIIKTYGHLDILVNNAGITRDNLIMKMSEEDFDAEVKRMAEGYKMEADKIKELMGEAGKKQIMEDLAVRKAVDFVVGEAVEK